MQSKTTEGLPAVEYAMNEMRVVIQGACGRRTLVCVRAKVRDYDRNEPLQRLICVYRSAVGHGTFDGSIASVRRGRDVGIPCDINEDLEA